MKSVKDSFPENLLKVKTKTKVYKQIKAVCKLIIFQKRNETPDVARADSEPCRSLSSTPAKLWVFLCFVVLFYFALFETESP